MIRYLLIDSKGASERFMLEPGEHMLGRQAPAEIVVDDASVSRKGHAKFTVSAAGCWIVDLGSPNGIKLNGNRVKGQAPLTNGDVLVLGNAKLRYFEESGSSNQMPRASADAGPDGIVIPRPHAGEAATDERRAQRAAPARRAPASAGAEAGKGLALYWKWWLYLVLLGSTFVAFAILSLLISRRDEDTVSQAGLLHLASLAAENRTALERADESLLRDDSVNNVNGVSFFRLVTTDGRVLLPEGDRKSALVLKDIMGVKLADLRSLVERTDGPVTRFAAPVKSKNVVIGYATIAWDPAKAGVVGKGSSIVWLGFLLVVAAAVVSVEMASRRVTGSIVKLTEDIESMGKGGHEDRPKVAVFPELDRLSETVAKLVWSYESHLSRDRSVVGSGVQSAYSAGEAGTAIASVTDLVSHGTIVLDAGYRIIHLNQGAVDILGAPPGDHDGQHILHLMSQQALAEAVTDLLQSTGEGQIAVREVALSGSQQRKLKVAVGRHSGASAAGVAYVISLDAA